MRRLDILPAAGKDLAGIEDFIAKQSEQGAEIVINALHAGMTRLRETPGIGHERKDVKNKQLRFLREHSYLIAYRFDNDSVTVIRVIHGARNFKKLFPN